MSKKTYIGDDETFAQLPEDEKIIKIAKERFRLAEEWESTARIRFQEDVRFINGDSRNNAQWDQSLLVDRGIGTRHERPCLTVNRAFQHIMQVVNDNRQNKTAIKISPTGDEATFEASQIFEGLIRHIEYDSNAEKAYNHAYTNMVEGGFGYVRVGTKYSDDNSFDQKIVIEAIEDPLSVYLDPDAKSDGTGAKYAFVCEDIPKDLLKFKYPNVKIVQNNTISAVGPNSWIKDKHIRVCEYYYTEEVKDILVAFVNPTTGEDDTFKMSDFNGAPSIVKKAINEQIKDPNTKTRDIITSRVKWVKIVGDEIVDSKEWPGDSIPIVPMVGIQTIIGGQLDRKGLTRALIDPQRILNYSFSAAVEFGALQSRTPYIAPNAAIEGYENYWSTANTESHAILPYNHKDDKGVEIPPPQRQEPPQSSPAFQQNILDAVNMLMMTTGQTQASFGEPGNERSGAAIQQRERSSENATFHFVDAQASTIRQVGKIILELIPKIYDTKRVVRIMGVDGSDARVLIDPEATQAHQIEKTQTEYEADQVIFNPNVGTFDVQADVGPEFGTRRQEAFNALTQIAAQNPALMGIIGDLVLRAADFPLAEEAAIRLERMVPNQAKGIGPNPQVAQLEQQLQALQGILAASTEKLQKLQSKNDARNDQKAIDMFRALTDREKVLLDHFGMSQQDFMNMQVDLLKQQRDNDHEISLTNQNMNQDE